MDSFEMPTDGLNLPADKTPASETGGQTSQPESKYRAEQAEPKRKASPRPPKQTVRETSPTKFFDGERMRQFLGIVLFTIAGYMLVSSISYIDSRIDDQSIVENHTLREISKNTDQINNVGGKFGAFFSNLFITNWLGIAAYIIIFYIGRCGWTLLRHTKIHFWRFTFKSLFISIALSIIFGSVTFGTVTPTFWGGRHGFYVTQFFYDNTAVWGTICVNIILASAVILMFLGPIRSLNARISSVISRHKTKLIQRYNLSVNSARAERAKMEATERKAAEQASKPSTDTITHDSNTTLQPENSAPTETVKESVEILHEDNTPVKEPVTLSPLGFEVPPYHPNTKKESLSQEPLSTDSKNNGNQTGLIVVNHKPIEAAEEIDIDAYDPTAELSRYRFPSIDLLRVRESSVGIIDEAEQEENKNTIINALRSYGVEIASIKATVGPTITLYEIIPAEGVRIAKIKRLGDDMTLSLSAIGIRIIAPMPGKGTIGMEVPNKNPRTVSIRSILSSKAYQESKAELPIAMGTTITNDVYVTDLAKMPHLLVAGATGMGKSVGLNTIIASLLYKKHPAELKFVLVDPKMVEFSLYKCLEHHFLAKLPDEDDAIITDPNKVVATLNSLCVEMDNRYALLSQAGMRGIKEYNQKFISRRLNPEKGHRYLPYIVVIIDEFADLIITAGKEVETPISRIAAKARAVGIHMILATQRPSVNVITGVIKANFPGRMAFRVTQMNDSRTILDRPGADQLIGRGDMLISRDGAIERVQCAFIDTDEVQAMCQSIAEQTGYPTAYALPDYIVPQEGSANGRESVGDRDPLFADAGRAIIESGTGSTSYLQRKYNIGYPRAGKIMDQLEAAGVVGASQGGKPRTVLMDSYSFERLLEP